MGSAHTQIASLNAKLMLIFKAQPPSLLTSVVAYKTIIIYNMVTIT